MAEIPVATEPRRDRSRRLHAAGLALTVLAVAGFSPTVGPQQPAPPHPVAEEAISKLRSPFCPGLMLEVCPTRDAETLRDSIQAGARRGLSADSLVEQMVAAYGEEYRAFPRREGAGLLAWLMPPVALVLGLGLVVVVLRRLKRSAPSLALSEELTDEDRNRLDTALAELERMEEEEA